MRFRKFALILCFAATAFAAKKKPEKTQTLELPKDPPNVAIGEASRLVFSVSPLSATGLLSQQTRVALKAILKANGGANIIHLRAFVAGSGDVRRVPQIVSEVLGKKMPLPSVSVIQAGALPMANAQVVIEAISETKGKAASEGVTFLPVQDSLDQLAAKAGTSKVLQASCFVSDLAKTDATLAAMAAKFPGASLNLVQMQRDPSATMTKCEAIARGGDPGRLAFTGIQAAIGGEEDDIKRAFTSMYKDLRTAGVDPDGIISTHIYPISPAVGVMVKALLDIPGAMNLIPFEGLASIDASLAVEAVAQIK